MVSPADIAAGITVELVILGVGLALIYRIAGKVIALPRRLVVPAFQAGVVFADGKPEREVGPGSYWLMPRRTIHICDTRPTPFQLPSQEFLTHDHMGVRITLTGEYRISNPTAFLTASSNSTATFLIELKQALRTAVSELAGQTFLATQHALPTRIRELLAPRATALGITLTLVDLAEAIPLGWLKAAQPATQTMPPQNLPYGPN